MKLFELVQAGVDRSHAAVDLRVINDILEESQAEVGDHVNIPVGPRSSSGSLGNLCFRRTA